MEREDDGPWYSDLDEDAAAPDTSADDSDDDQSDDSPDDDDAPDADETDDDAADEPDEDEEEEEEDLPSKAARLEAELQRRDAEDRQRADQAAQEAQKQQQAQEQQLQAQRQYTRKQAWDVYQGKKARLQQARNQDWETANESGDPRRLWDQLQTQRRREEAEIDWEYQAWREQDQAAEQYQLRHALAAASVRQYADHVREAYRLPHDSLNEITHFKDGTPVDPNAYSARAAELVERRNERATERRRQTRQAREEGRTAVRGKSPAPGRGQSAGPREITGSLEELHEYFPMYSDTVRAQRQRERKRA